MHGTHGIQHYTIIAMLYLQIIKDKYIEIYNEFISQLLSLVTPLKLQEILDLVTELYNSQFSCNPIHNNH